MSSPGSFSLRGAGLQAAAGLGALFWLQPAASTGVLAELRHPGAFLWVLVKGLQCSPCPWGSVSPCPSLQLPAGDESLCLSQLNPAELRGWDVAAGTGRGWDGTQQGWLQGWQHWEPL